MENPAHKLENYTPKEARVVIPMDCAGFRLDQALSRLVPEFSRSRLQSWIKEGLVTVDGNIASPKHKLWGGESVLLRLAPDPKETAYGAEDIPLAIIFEDDQIIVIDKPAGLVVHPGSGNWEGTLLNALLHHCPFLSSIPRAGIVHRLDKETSGLLVAAKTLQAQTSLVRQLQGRTVKRIYLALVHGKTPESGTVDAPIGRHAMHRTKMAVSKTGKEARTHFATIKRFEGCSLVECALESGRTHQIRVHMNHIGHPLVGDPVYGKNPLNAANREILSSFKRQALHAMKLSFLHPQSGEPVSFESELPADFAQLLEKLK